MGLAARADTQTRSPDRTGHPARIARRWAGMALLLCALGAGQPAASAERSFYREAPDLAARVDAGTLPPVDQRLPGNPLLLSVDEEIGRYGGTWGMAMVGQGDGALIYRSIGYEHLVRWDPAWRRVIPNVAQSFKVSDDARSFTFRLRPGMRWSDGVPFTAEDVRFWFDHVLMEPELTVVQPSWLPRGADAVRLEVDDPYTVRFVFREPNAVFLGALASAVDLASGTAFPRHALSRYVRALNPDGIAAEVAAAGVATWADLFELKAGLLRSRSDASGLLRRPVAGLDTVATAERIPTLNAWMIDRIEPGDPPRLVAERNPFYWKIDPVGHQLPYIDRAVFALTTTPERVVELLASGSIGMQARHLVGPAVQSRLDDFLAHGYRPLVMQSAETNTLPIAFNLAHPDPLLHAVLDSTRFRVALSQALDRRAIIAAVYGGRGEPAQVAPRPESRFYSERLASQHLDLDPAAANAALDAMGLAAREPDGIRRLSDGRRLSLSVLVRFDRPHHRRALEMVAAQWRAVGVEIRPEPADRTEILRRAGDNDYDLLIGQTDGGIDAIQEAYAYIPVLGPLAAPQWARWLDDPASPNAVAPPEPIRHQLDLFSRLKRSPDPDEQDWLMRAILEIAADEFYTIGVSSQTAGKALVRSDFRNVPRVMLDAWAYPNPAPTNPAQYFIASP